MGVYSEVVLVAKTDDIERFDDLLAAEEDGMRLGTMNFEPVAERDGTTVMSAGCVKWYESFPEVQVFERVYDEFFRIGGRPSRYISVVENEWTERDLATGDTSRLAFHAGPSLTVEYY